MFDACIPDPSWKGYCEIVDKNSLIFCPMGMKSHMLSAYQRIADYIAALEAALVPKSFLIQRSLKERAVRLLGLTEDKARQTKKLLGKFYAVRSALVHGASVKDQLLLLQDRNCWYEFEQLVRDLIVAALRKVPAEENSRQSYLASLYETDDNARAEQIEENFKAIKDPNARKSLLAVLSTSQQ